MSVKGLHIRSVQPEMALAAPERFFHLIPGGWARCTWPSVSDLRMSNPSSFRIVLAAAASLRGRFAHEAVDVVPHEA